MAIGAVQVTDYGGCELRQNLFQSICNTCSCTSQHGLGHAEIMNDSDISSFKQQFISHTIYITNPNKNLRGDIRAFFAHHSHLGT